MRFIKFGRKSVKIDSIEAVTTYMEQVTIHTERNSYTTYYNNQDTAQKTYTEILAQLEGDENA